MNRPPHDVEQRFIEAYDQYADALFRHCAFRIGDREKAIELMQETYMKVWEYLSQGHEVENLRAFLYRVANNLVIDFARQRAKRKTNSLEEMQEKGFDLGNHDDEKMQTRFDAQQIMAVLDQVEEPYRTAVILRYVNGLPPREIADILEISANVTSVRINRGLEKLRSLLPPNG